VLGRGKAAAAAFLAALGVTSPALAADCPNAGAVKVPGAEMQKSACLDDLTTAGTALTGHTDQSDWEGLHASATRNPSGVPGLQVDGYFPDTSTSNNENGWNHDSQFVIRFPNNWNGKLVITGAPGIRKQYAPDFVIGDWALARGYAYASTDKGNDGDTFYEDGATPGDAVAEWNMRVTQLTVAVKEAVRQRYGRAPSRTYMTGISNGGYLTRWQVENRPDLYDGGVDWEGTLIRPEPPNLFTYLPVALRNYPKYRATGDPAAHAAMIAAGFEPGSEFLWDDHYSVYWDLTQRSYREEFDPDYDGPLKAGIPFCQPGTPSCDADYDYAKRPPAVRSALAKAQLTGRIGKPLLTLHGTYDSLLPIRTDSDVYNRMVDRAGKGAAHRYYVVEHGNHVDGRYDLFPDRLRPILPCYRTAFGALERWVEHGSAPPPSQFVPDVRTGDVVNNCALASTGAGAGPAVPVARRLKPRGVRLRVTPARDRRPPFVFRVRGRVLLPRGLKPARACGSGVVLVRVLRGRRTVATRRPAVTRTCAFHTAVRLGARRGRLRIKAKFFGNRALHSAAARRVLAQAG
jgi:predicted esterase